MPRTSPVHYIVPSAISITPNANNSANDLAVYIARDAAIKVFSHGIAALGYDSNGNIRQWTLSGRNRRLADYSKPQEEWVPYTIYARLAKQDTSDGYLIFTPQQLVGGEWVDRYPHVTDEGLSTDYYGTPSDDYWYVRLGEVTLPEEGLREVVLDTGILGTEQYNGEWNYDPDQMPMRVQVYCSAGGEDAGPKPYVPWGGTLVLEATLLEGWAVSDTDRLDHWTIERNTGDAASDAQWNAAHAASFAILGSATLSHARGLLDDFSGAVSTLFTVTAWERAPQPEPEPEPVEGEGGEEEPAEDPEPQYLQLAQATINIMAETVEQFELSLSTNIVGYNPQTETYSPGDGVNIRVRATDQRSDVCELTPAQLTSAAVQVAYAPVDGGVWTTVTFTATATGVAEGNIPVSAFAAQKSLVVRITREVGTLEDPEAMELSRATVAFVRDGEDSRDREWIFLRTLVPDYGLLPSLITVGEVDPTGAAGAVTAYNDTLDGWVPQGWYDEQQGVDDVHIYEYGSYRDYIRGSEEGEEGEEGGGHWGAFTTPRIWGHWGDDAVAYDIVPDTSVINADAKGVVTSDGIVVRAYRTKGSDRSANILPDPDIPAEGDYYMAEYSVDGGTWTPCIKFLHPETTDGGVTVDVYRYGMAAATVKTARSSVAFRLKHTSEPTVVLKENTPIEVLKLMTEEDTQDIIDTYGGGLYLSKVIDDVAAGHITFERGLRAVLAATFGTYVRTAGSTPTGAAITPDGTGDFIDLVVKGMVRGNLTVQDLLNARDIIFRNELKGDGARRGFTDGTGIYMNAAEGLIETDGLNVRGFMRVMELIINRLQLMESDYSFTEGDTVDHIDYEDSGQTLVLTMHKDHDNDYTPFYPGDIVYGIVNDLLPKDAPVPDGHSVTRNGSYYYTWMRVKSVDHTSNKIRVALYQGKLQDNTPVVQGGTNFSPAGTAITTDVTAPMLEEYEAHGGEGYDTMLTLTRHGNVADGIDPETGQYDEHIHESQLGRQQAWVLSTTDKRLSFFWNVDQPIIRNENYALCLGILPDLPNLPSWRNPNMPSLYINTLFADNIEQANYPARVVKTDRGPWSQSPTATYDGEYGGTWTPDGTTRVDGDTTVYDQHTKYGTAGVSQTFVVGQTIAEPYHCRTFTKSDWLSRRLDTSRAGNTDAQLERVMLRMQPKADLEVSRVWNNGIIWECLLDGTTQAPIWDSTDWQAIGGDTIFYCEIASSAGTTFRNGNVDTILTMETRYGQEDVTDRLLQTPGATVRWIRKTGWDAVNHCFVQTSEDRTWQATQGATAKSIILTRSDMGSGWMIDYRQAMFCCSIYVPDGNTSEVTEYSADFIQKA